MQAGGAGKMVAGIQENKLVIRFPDALNINNTVTGRVNYNRNIITGIFPEILNYLCEMVFFIFFTINY